MIRSPFIVFLLICTVCSSCGRDFMSLGHHAWRCKRRFTLGSDASNWKSITKELPSELRHPVNTNKSIKCCCDKDCKGIRGLKMHQRNCRVMQGLGNELCEQLQEGIENSYRNTSSLGENTENNVEDVTQISGDFSILKLGIKLPKSPHEWSTANEHFKAAFSNAPITASDIDSSIKTMNNIIYTYFVEKCGYVDSPSDGNDHLLDKYRGVSVKDLKKMLR